MFNTRSICRGDAGEIGRHIGKYKVRPARAKRFLKLRPNRRFPKIALDEQNARNLFHWQQIKRNHGAIETAASDPPREPVAHVLTPTAGRSAQIDYAQSCGSVCPADQFPEVYRRRGTGTLRAARVGRKDRKDGRVTRRASRECSRTGIMKLFLAECGEPIVATRRPLENALNYGFGKYSNGSTGLPCLRTSKCSMTRLASLSPISAIFWPCATVSFSLANSLRLCAYAVRKVALCFTMMR